MLSDLAVSTYTGLGRQPLPEFLHAVADSGQNQVEVLAAPPHVDLEHVGEAAAMLAPVLRETGLRVTSVVPSGVDVNLASSQAGMRAWSRQQFIAAATLAGEIGAPRVVVHPGRRHPLRPPTRQELWDRVLDGLEAIVSVAETTGVEVLLENVPTGLIDTAEECRQVSESLDGRVGLCLDVANAFMVEDVVQAIASLPGPPALVHVSDTRAEQWLHDPLGTGEVAWDDVVGALLARPYDGPVVLETLHEQSPAEGLRHDARYWADCVARCRQRMPRAR